MMNEEEWEDALYEGLDVQFDFAGGGPTWGDLLALSGAGPSPEFPSSGRHDVAKLASLGFDGVDDYLGIRNECSDGDDVIVWLFPIVDEQEAYHHAGPFDAIRLSYSVLRNSAANAARFLNAVKSFTDVFAVSGVYRLRATSLGIPADVAPLQKDIEAIVRHWRAEGIEPGSSGALELER
jgi:hypothetical protein